MKPKIKIFFGILIFLVLISVFALTYNIQASALHTLSDKMSRHAPLTPANHQIKFSTPSGIGEPNNYLRVYFDFGFDLTQIDYQDIDLSHGFGTGYETEEVLTDFVNSTDWRVAVALNYIDFFHPNNPSNGDILPNEIIIIQIGTNADSGVNQIINPATTGSKIISLSGNYGDTGKLAVAIFEDQVGTGGQTLLAPPSPVVLNDPINIQRRSMDLSWSQNNDFDFNRYELYMGTVTGVTNTSGTLLASFTNNTDLSYQVTALESNTDYFFILYVYDDEGLFTPSNEVNGMTTGRTIPPPPEEPLVEDIECPFFRLPVTISGTRSANATIYINGSTSNVYYSGLTEWNAVIPFLNLGSNPIEIYAKDSQNQTSPTVISYLKFWRIGDNIGNFRVTDFHLSGLVYHWGQNWCYSDFKKDGIINDFDLSGLAANWDGIYEIPTLPPCDILGDVNRDYTVDWIDYYLVEQMLISQMPYDSCGDINLNGVIDPPDQSRMYDEVNGATTNFGY